MNLNKKLFIENENEHGGTHHAPQVEVDSKTTNLEADLVSQFLHFQLVMRPLRFHFLTLNCIL